MLIAAGLSLVISTAGSFGTSANADDPAPTTTTSLLGAATTTVSGTITSSIGGTTSSTTSTTSTTTIVGAANAKTAAIAPLAVPATATKPAKRLRQTGSLLFPMQTTPVCNILDNFGDARMGGRSHEGTDILATSGQEVYAVADGVLKRQYVVGGPSSSLSGNAWQLSEPNGTYYFYAHLSRFAADLVVGSTVTKGDLIGYVGDTGDAGPGNNHLHFEVHPGGGAAVNALTLVEVPASCVVW